MLWVVKVGYKDGISDPMGDNIKKDIQDLNIEGVKQVKSMPTYLIEGDFSEEQIKKVCEELLADPVSQNFQFYKSGEEAKINESGWVVEVNLKRGVTDAVGDSVKEGIKVLNVGEAEQARTAMTYVITGDISEEDLETICKRCLANGIIQDYKYERVAAK